MINVSTGEFFGPFDLLLDLIKKSKYNIYEVKLSEITNEYINSINQLNIPADETADFILIATQLLYMKTTSLLSDIESDDDEEIELISEDELLKRLIEYERIKKVVIKLRDLEDIGLKKHYKLQEDLSRFSSNTENIVYNLEKLKETLEMIINSFLNEDIFKVDKILNIEEFSLEKYNEKIKIELIKNKILSITKMIKSIPNKSEVIIIFLSILELSKSKLLFIEQDLDTFEITVKINEVSNEQEGNKINN